MKEITPNFKTPDADLNEVERFKLRSGIRGQLKEQFDDLSVDNVDHETEALAKSHGIYLEFNRAKTGKEKDWMYMARISIPGGGPLNRNQWQILDDLAERFTKNDQGQPSLRMTTRQNIQFHWIQKRDLIDLVRIVAQTGFFSLNGCGDNIRNVMGCPMSPFSNIYDANKLAHKFGQYFQLDMAPHIEIFGIDRQYVRQRDEHYRYGKKLLNRKFKIGFSAIHRDPQNGKWVPDNCVEVRTNDIGVVPILENDRVERFQIYIGGGQGERNGKATFAALAKPLGIVTEDKLIKTLDAIVKVHEEWGDRQNRHWARIKYVVHMKGVDWFREQLAAKGVELEPPDEQLDIGDRHLHHGWMPQENNGLWSFGAFIENGRIIDSQQVQLKSMVRHLMEAYETQLLITPNQDLIFTDIPEEKKEDFNQAMERFGYGQRNEKPYSNLRLKSGSCVALPTCRLAYTDSERFLPGLIDELEERGYGEMTESIGITGCERQCFRPATKTIGWIGTGKNQYQLKLLGSENARHQGKPLIGKDQLMVLRMVPRDKIAAVTAALFDYYKTNRHNANEGMGEFHNRIGLEAIIDHLKTNEVTSELMKKTFKPIYIEQD